MSDTKRLTDAEVIRDRGLAEATMETVASAAEAEEARGRLDADHLQAREDVTELLREVRMAFRDLSPNITGPSRESVDRCRERLRALIMQRGNGEFLT